MTQLYANGRKSVAEIETKLQQDLNTLIQWCNTNKHGDTSYLFKTTCMLVGGPYKTKQSRELHLKQQ